MHSVAEAAIESGIRAVLTRSTMDQGAFIPASWQQTTNECISRTEALYRDYNGAGDGRLQVWYSRPIMERVEKFVGRVSRRGFTIDLAQFELTGIDPEIRPLLGPFVVQAINERISKHLEFERRHPLDIRRYYRRLTY